MLPVDPFHHDRPSTGRNVDPTIELLGAAEQQVASALRPAALGVCHSRRRSMNMPVMLQSCGQPTPKRKSIKGPNAPANALLLNCTGLPNPYKRMKEYEHEVPMPANGGPKRELDIVKCFLRGEALVKLDKLVARGKAAVESGKPVVAQCAFGKHRSRAVLELIGELFPANVVYYVHRET